MFKRYAKLCGILGIVFLNNVLWIIITGASFMIEYSTKPMRYPIAPTILFYIFLIGGIILLLASAVLFILNWYQKKSIVKA